MSENVQVTENQQESMSDAMLARLRAVPMLAKIPDSEVEKLLKLLVLRGISLVPR